MDQRLFMTRDHDIKFLYTVECIKYINNLSSRIGKKHIYFFCGFAIILLISHINP